MKKIIYILITIFLLIPVKTFALTGSTNLTCDKRNITKGTTITCTLSGIINEDNVKKYTGTVSLGQGLELISVTKDEVFSTGENNTANMVYDNARENTTGNFNIATIIIKANDNLTTGMDTTITIGGQTLLGVTDTEGKSLSNTSQPIRILSDNNNLSSLTISSGTLNPTFRSDIKEYNVETTEKKVTITATPEDNTATVDYLNEVELVYGENVIIISVESETEKINTYKLRIVRPDGRSTVNTIKSLTLNNQDIEIKDNVLEYTVRFDENVTKLVMNATLTDEKSSFVEDYEPRTINLEKGTNLIQLRVKSEAESVRAYLIKVIRGKETPIEKQKNETTNNTTKTNTISNPKTGSTFIKIIISLLFISIATVVLYYNKIVKEIK